MGPQQGEKGQQESKQHFSGVRDTQGSHCWEFQVMLSVLGSRETERCSGRRELSCLYTAEARVICFRAFKAAITPPTLQKAGGLEVVGC